MAFSEVASIGRALRALELLAAEAMTVSELSRRLESDRGTVYRMLTTLEANGYIQRDSTGQHYHISPAKIISFYGLVEGRNELTQMARPILAELRDRTNETASLGVLAEDGVMIIAQERSRAMLSASAGLGRHVEVHCTALGKALAAFLPSQRLTDILARRGLAVYTPRTITSLDGLLAHFERIRQLGFAVDDEEAGYEIRCVAAPIRGHVGQVIASIGITGPATRITLRRAHELSVPVMDAARHLSVATGWDPHNTDGTLSIDQDRDRSSPAAPNSSFWGGFPEP